MRKTWIVFVALSLIALVLTQAGCGGDAAASATAAANEVVALFQSGRLAQARRHFIAGDGFTAVMDTIHGQRAVAIGSVRSQDASSAEVDIVVGGTTDAQGMTLMMVRSQGEWKILRVVR
jgi:hypothetical protein